MGKRSDAKRKAKLKERHAHAEAAAVRALINQAKVREWLQARDAEPNIAAELVDEDGSGLAHVEGSVGGDWTVIVGGESVAGTEDELVAVGWLISAALDDQAHDESAFLQFSPWLVEEIERACESRNMGWEEFLRSLVPLEKRHMALPNIRIW